MTAAGTACCSASAQRPRPKAHPLLRRALYSWAFNKNVWKADVREEWQDALDWPQRRSLPVSELEEPNVLRRGLDGLCRKVDGAAAAAKTGPWPSPVRLRRLHGTLTCCVVLELFSLAVSGDPESLLPQQDVHWLPLVNIGLVTIPVGFLLGWAGSRVRRRPTMPHLNDATEPNHRPQVRAP
jgi:hypothetical protein